MTKTIKTTKINKIKKLRPLSEFGKEEFKQSSQNANFTKLANIMGFKVTANKVINTVMLKKITSWQKVEVLSNITALETIYIGGSANIDGVIVNMCSDYIGSNNYPLLEHKGDFGARLDNSSAASRYIFTKASDNFSNIFNPEDLNILERYNFEGQDIEYKFLTYNIPMLLVNGSEGMGSGHAQKIFPRDPKVLVKAIKAKLNGKKLPDLKVHYNGFTGTVERGEPNQWIISGDYKVISKTKLSITEVPIGENYKSYKKKLDKLVDDKVINKYVDLCDPKKDTFLYTINCSSSFLQQSKEDILVQLKLVSKMSENFTVIDENNAVKVHKSAEEVFDHYFDIKMKYLGLRKEYLIKNTNDRILTALSKVKFIELISSEELKVHKRKKSSTVQDLKKYKEIVERDESYDYLLNMSIQSLSTERLQALKLQAQELQQELKTIETITLKDMWLNDLKRFK